MLPIKTRARPPVKLSITPRKKGDVVTNYHQSFTARTMYKRGNMVTK
jgi:hypothetical protein